jgi:hypothetical protein
VIVKTSFVLGWILSVVSLSILSAINSIVTPIWAYLLVTLAAFMLFAVEKWPGRSGYFYAFYVVLMAFVATHIILEGYWVKPNQLNLVMGFVVGIGTVLAPIIVKENKPIRYLSCKSFADVQFSASALSATCLSGVAALIALFVGAQMLTAIMASVFW